MKKITDKYHLLLGLLFPVLFVISYFYFQSRFLERLDFWMDKYSGRLKEDGLSSQQVHSIIDASKQASELAFNYTQDIYTLFILMLSIFVVLTFHKVKTMEREIENLKDKLNV